MRYLQSWELPDYLLSTSEQYLLRIQQAYKVTLERSRMQGFPQSMPTPVFEIPSNLSLKDDPNPQIPCPESSFMKLPIEIRSEIYNHLIDDIPEERVSGDPSNIHLAFDQRQFMAFYPFVGESRALLNVNHELLHDMAQYLGRRHRSFGFCFDAPSQGIRFLKNIPEYLPELWRVEFQVPASEINLIQSCIDLFISSSETRVHSLSLLFAPLEEEYDAERTAFEREMSKVLNRMKQIPTAISRDVWFLGGGGWKSCRSEWAGPDSWNFTKSPRYFEIYFYPITKVPKATYKLLTLNVGYEGMLPSQVAVKKRRDIVVSSYKTSVAREVFEFVRFGWKCFREPDRYSMTF